MNILVTNDDGVDNPGIWALARAVRELGDITVVAPADNQSGVGAGLSFRKSAKIREYESQIENVPCFAVDGTPGDSVAFGINRVLNNTVDAVVSGINPGNNTSRNVFISGTFGAAIISAALGVKACAFSIGPFDDVDNQLVGRIITATTSELLSPDTPRAGLYNINFPPLQYSGFLGAEGCAPALSELKMKLEANNFGGFELFSGLRLNIDRLELTPGTDVEVLSRNRVALSAFDGNTLVHDQDDPGLQRMIAAANSVIG